MDRGRIRQFATPEALYDRPQDCFVAGFVGDGAVVALRGVGGGHGGRVAVQLLGQRLSARTAESQPTHVCIRPEHLRLDPEGPIAAQVSACSYQGGRFRLVLETAGERLIAHAASRARPGEAVRLSLGAPWAFRDPAGPVAGPLAPQLRAEV